MRMRFLKSLERQYYSTNFSNERYDYYFALATQSFDRCIPLYVVRNCVVSSDGFDSVSDVDKTIVNDPADDSDTGTSTGEKKRCQLERKCCINFFNSYFWLFVPNTVNKDACNFHLVMFKI